MKKKAILLTSCSLCLFTTVFFGMLVFTCPAQTSVTRIYTDHQGFFTSASSSPHSVDVATHHLLAFQTGSTVWSTGVNDDVLSANTVNFVPLEFQAMPATVHGYQTNGAFIGIGRQYGGFWGDNGCSPAVSPPFGNDISAYLTDGIQGLDLSTAIFNIGGNIAYTVNNIYEFMIGDGIPDIIVTQTGDAGGSQDYFRFRDSYGNIVGTQKAINFTSVDAVAYPFWKFYNMGNLGCGGSAAGTRPLRILAFDLADLGITASNYMNIATFEHQLSPTSDVAFVAYNTLSIDILPVTLVNFNAEMRGRQVLLTWETASEINNDLFTVERSSDGFVWEKVLTRKGAGTSNELLFYEETDPFPLQGTAYYRLKQTDFSGNYTYSDIVAVNVNRELEIYPNPVSGILSIRGGNNGDIKIVNALGADVTGQVVFVNKSPGFIQVNFSNLRRGYYFIHYEAEVYPVIVMD